MRKVVAALLFVVVGSALLSAADPSYQLIKEIPIGGTGGWDYISVDPQAHRLYVSHATKIEVVDLDTGKVVGQIADTPRVHGFAIAPDLGRGFSSNGGDNTVTIVDLKTLKPISKVNTGVNPDAIMYEPKHKVVYAFNGSSNSATVFDAQSGKLVTTIALVGKPEAAVFDEAADRVFVNLEDVGSMAVIDAADQTLLMTWRLGNCEEPTGLGFDPASHRLFSACANKIMAVTDGMSGKRVTSIPIGTGADGAAFDPGTQLAFSSNGEGTVTIAHLDAPDKLTVVQTLKTQASARTMILDPVSHNIYLPAATMMPAASGQRAQPVPNTFKVLVYGMK